MDERWWCKEGANFVKKMKLAAPRFWLRSENDDVNSTNVTVHLSSVYVKTRGSKILINSLAWLLGYHNCKGVDIWPISIWNFIKNFPASFVNQLCFSFEPLNP